MRTRRDARGIIDKPRLRPADLLTETFSGLLARPARVALTLLWMVVGIAALVAALGLSKTASSQFVGRFDPVAATDVVVKPAIRGPRAVPSVLPLRVEDRLQRLNGVVAAGSLSNVNVGGDLVSSAPVNNPIAQTRFQLPVKAVSPGLWRAVRARLATGRFPDAGHSATGERVAVLGPRAAGKLNLTRIDHQPAIFLGDRLYLVVGILDDVERQPSLLSAVTIPEGTAVREYGLQAPGLAQIETEIGAVDLIAEQAPLVLTAEPDALTVAVKKPRGRTGVLRNDLNLAFVLLAGVSLLAGAIAIGQATLASVLGRSGEIGLRGALGASRRQIASQLVAEGGAMGAVGGIAGASLGTLLVAGISATRSWTPAIDPAVLLAATLLGALIGLAAGAYPALRAARIEPCEALRVAR